MKKEKGYIYIIKLGEYYKIGKSKNFRKRIGEYTQLYATPEIIIVEWVRDYHNFEKFSMDCEEYVLTLENTGVMM